MADGVDITIEGLESVFKNMEALDPRNWKEPALKQMRADQSTVRSDMRSAAPNKKGITTNSIRTVFFVSGSADSLELKASTSPRFDGSTKAWYSHFTELGTPRQKKQLYILGAGKKNYDKVLNGMLSIISDMINKANGNA